MAKLFLKGLPLGTTADELSSFFWEKLGLDVEPKNLQIKDHANVATCFVHISAQSLADFMARCCQDQMPGHTLKFEPEISKAAKRYSGRLTPFRPDERDREQGWSRNERSPTSRAPLFASQKPPTVASASEPRN